MHQQNPLPFTTPTGRAQIVAHIRRHPLGREPQEQRANFVRLTLGTANGSAQPARQSIALGGAGTRGTLVYFHGGGYSFGSPQTHERIGRALAQRSGLRVVLPAYPLAPEARWPAQLDAAVVAVRREARAHDAPVLLAGDSAGGHLALVTALALARVGKPVAGLLLFHPTPTAVACRARASATTRWTPWLTTPATARWRSAALALCRCCTRRFRRCWTT